MSNIFPISKPAKNLFKLVSVSLWNEQGLTVYWDNGPIFQVTSDYFRANGSRLKDDRGYIYDENDGEWDEPIHEWWAQAEDGNICDSLSFFTKIHPLLMAFTNLFVFKKKGHGKAADEQLNYEIYDCDWSDFACENMFLEFNVQAQWNNYGDKYARAGIAFADRHRSYLDGPSVDKEQAYASLMKAKDRMGLPPYLFRNGEVEAEFARIQRVKSEMQVDLAKRARMQ